MINRKKVKSKIKNVLIKFLLASTVIGILIGGFFSFNFMGEPEKTFKMNKFEFSSIDISKASRIMESVNQDLNKDNLESSVIEWFMIKETYKKMAKRLNIVVPQEEVSDFIKNNPKFKDEEGNFSSLKYKNYLKVNVIDVKFYENIVKDELLIGKLKGVIDSDLFDMNDPLILANKINKEYHLTVLIADTDKIVDFLNIDKIKDFISEHKIYLKTNVKLEKITHNENMGVGDFNILINNKTELDKFLNSNHIKTHEYTTMKKSNEKTKKIVIHDNTYIYKNESSFYVVSFVNKNRTESEIEFLKNEFQYIKKTEFLKSYINKMIDNGKTLSEISETQQYFKLSKEITNFENGFVNQDGREKIIKTKDKEVFMIKEKPYYVTAILDSIENKEIINSEDFQVYHKKNMELMFLDILNKTVTENY
jgi:hypothetical protein